ncbi:MAG: ferritin-like domain-containing protein [Terracidiphilus sp.]
MKTTVSTNKSAVDRRSFMKSGLMAGGAATLGAGLLSHANLARAQERSESGRLNQGDTAILRFLAAAELIEADLWTQYAELGGLTSGKPIEVDPTQTLNAYQTALSQLDTDGPQYITSNTLDEISHAAFLNAYLKSKGAEKVNFDKFLLPLGSTATGSSEKKRLTNLTHLNVDTSWFVRYRSTTNPDLGATFPQAITLTDRTAIPITDADFKNTDHIQVIANTAAFHFGAIEQGGTSLYATLSQKVTHPEVLKITLSIGGDEIAHFLEWVDFAGNGVQVPVAPVTDPDTGLTFPNFFDPLNKVIQPSLIFPVPCQFISADLPKVAIIRPTSDEFSGATAAIAGFIASGLFTGQSQEFLDLLQEMAFDADQAFRR